MPHIEGLKKAVEEKRGYQMSNDLVTRSDGKMVSMDTWSALMIQATELLKSGFLPTSIKTPAQAIAIILTGRELGIGIMQSLRQIHVIENKPSIPPELMLSLIYNSGQAENIIINSQETFCEVAMTRKGMSEIKVKFTTDDAQKLGLLYRDNWKRQQKNMLRWRCVAACARLAFPDITAGLYTPEELESSEDVVGKDVSALELSEKVNSDPAEYDRWSQEIKVKILDDIFACETVEQLSHIKKQYAEDMGRLMDEDRAYIQTELDSAFQNLVSGEKEPGIQPLVETTLGIGQDKAEMPITAPKTDKADPNADLVAREAFGKEFLPKVVKELELCHTRAQITVFKNKIVQDRMKLLPEAKEYLDALFKQTFEKVK